MTILISCKFIILILTQKFKLGHKFFQFFYRFKIWILECWSWAVYTCEIFPIHVRDGKLGFLSISLGCTYKLFLIHLRVWKLGFLKMVMIVFQEQHVHKRWGASLWLNCLFSREKTYILTYIDKIILCQFKSYKYCF